MWRCQYAGNDSGYLPKPSLSVHGSRPFPACLSLDSHLIVIGIRKQVKIQIQIHAEFIGIAVRRHNGKPLHAQLTLHRELNAWPSLSQQVFPVNLLTELEAYRSHRNVGISCLIEPFLVCVHSACFVLRTSVDGFLV